MTQMVYTVITRHTLFLYGFWKICVFIDSKATRYILQDHLNNPRSKKTSPLLANDCQLRR